MMYIEHFSASSGLVWSKSIQKVLFWALAHIDFSSFFLVKGLLVKNHLQC